MSSIQPSDATSEKRSSQQKLRQLFEILDTRFDDGELRTLCFHLEGVDYDSLPGAGKTDKARELLSYLERRQRILELVALGRQLRPDVSWGDAPKVTEEAPPQPASASIVVTVTGGGAAVVGDGTAVVGERGIHIGRDAHGPIRTGDD